MIDDAAAKAKKLAEKTGQAAKNAANKVVEVTKETAAKIKDAADKKLGA